MLKTGSGGNFAYSDLAPSGGLIAGIVALPSDATTNDAILVDAAQVVTAGDEIVLDASRQASVEMSDTPTGTAAPVSLWQMNLAVLRAERLSATRLTGPRAAAVITGVSAWVAQSARQDAHQGRFPAARAGCAAEGAVTTHDGSLWGRLQAGSGSVPGKDSKGWD